MTERYQPAGTDLQAALARLEALNQLSARIAAAQDRGEILRLVVEATARLLGAPYAVLWTVDAARGYMTVAAEEVDERLGHLPPQSPVPLSRSFATTVLQEGRPVALPDVRHDPRWMNQDWPGLVHLGAYLGVPLARDEALVGILAAMDRPGRTFTGDEAELLRSLATHAALAIEKAELLQAARQAAEQAKALVEVGKLLAETVDLDVLLARIAEKATELLRASACSIGLLEGSEDNAVLRFPHTRGPAAAYGQALQIRAGEAVGGKAIQERRPVWTADALNDPGLQLSQATRQQMLEHGIPRAVLAAPMIRGETAIGMLAAHRPTGSAYTPPDVEVIAALAGQAAIAIENARLYGETQASLGAIRQQHTAARALLEVAQTLTQTLDLDSVLDLIVDKVLAVSGADACGISGVTPGGDLEYVRGKGFHNPLRPPLNLLRGEGVMGRCLEVGAPVWGRDALEDPGVTYRPETRAHVQAEGIHGSLAVPITTANGCYGVLFIGRRRPHDHRREEIEFAQGLAAQAAIAIHNAWLFQQEKERRQQLEAVRAVTEEITRELDLAVLLKLIAHRATELSKTTSSVIYVWDEQAQLLVPRAWHGFTEWIRDLRLRLGEGLAGAAAQRRERAEVNDYRTSPISHPLALKHTDMTAAVAEPLLHHDRLVGVIVITNQGSGRSFSEQDYTILSLFASQAAIAIENARLYEESQRRANEAAAHADVARALGTTLDMDRVLEVIVEEVRRLTGTPFAGIMALDEERQELSYVKAAGVSFSHIAGLRLKVGEGIAGLAVEQRAPVQSARLSEDPRVALPAFAESQGFRSLLCVPLLAGVRPLGVLAVFRREEHGFSQAEVQLLTRFADQAALAIENARLYAQVRSYSGELERKVAERTAELEKANQAKTEFLTTMSHELRTPLNAIIGFSEMLHMQTFGPLNPKQERYVSNIKTGGVHLLNLVNDVLDLARVEAGRLVLHIERVLLPPAIGEALDTVRPQAEKKGLTLASELEADLPALSADPVRLRQILVNLLSNAVKFTPSGGRVVVRIARSRAGDGPLPSPTDVVEIHVEDTGIGFAPDDLGRLFRKFEQLDAGLSKAHKGTGLGLALTRHLVELHGGTIAAHSGGRGQGATFTVRLPEGTKRERPEVLVVDDDPVVVEMLTSAMRGWDWEAAAAGSLAEARTALSRATPDLIIQDVSLPDGSGVGFVREVRRALAPRVPILMYTGLGAAEGETALEAGADDYVVKPAPLEVIRRKAGKLLARAGWPGAAQETEVGDAGAPSQGAAPLSIVRERR